MPLHLKSILSDTGKGIKKSFSLGITLACHMFNNLNLSKTYIITKSISMHTHTHWPKLHCGTISILWGHIHTNIQNHDIALLIPDWNAIKWNHRKIQVLFTFIYMSNVPTSWLNNLGVQGYFNDNFGVN